LDSAARQTAALKHHFSMAMSNGMRLAKVSRVSEGEVHSPPVVAKAPALCVLASLMVVLVLPLTPAVTFVLFAGAGVYHTSAP
jgi:hypothetical protein